jgi:hypothetical protein
MYGGRIEFAECIVVPLFDTISATFYISSGEARDAGLQRKYICNTTLQFVVVGNGFDTLHILCN